MKKEAARDVRKSLPQQSGKQHKIVVVNQNDVSLFVHASNHLQELFVGVGVCLEHMAKFACTHMRHAFHALVAHQPYQPQHYFQCISSVS